MKLGGLDITDVKIGDTQVDKVYQGEDLVWQYVPPVPFEFTVKTDNAGVSASNEFRMPLTTSTGLNIQVDWGDFSPIETITNHTLAIHTYAAAGTYTIKVLGSLLGWQFANGGDKFKMLNISSWESLTISVDQGFYGCTNLTATATDAPLITSTSLSSYFNFCVNFNGAIGNWDVSNVAILNRMLASCSVFNQDIGSWDVSNVTDMQFMFINAFAFNQDIGAWNVSNVTNFSDFMTGKTAANYSPSNLDSIYNGWSSLPSVQPNLSINFGGIVYSSASQSGKNILTSAPNNWVITDGGVLRTETFEFSVKTDNAGVSASNEFRMPLTTSTGLNFDVDWGDGTPIETITNHTLAIHTYASAGTYTISTVGNVQSWRFNNGGDKLKMLNVSQWAGLNISVGEGFYGCINLTATATDAPLITSTSLANYFNVCVNFNGEIGNWDVSNVAILNRMLASCSVFNQDIGSWDVSNVTDMQVMFIYATAFNQDIGGWDVSNVTNFTSFMLGKTAADYSAANLDSIYNNWSLLSVQPNLSISFGSIKYTAAGAAGKAILTGSPNNWTIVDGGI
jgi:surface protein